VKSLGDSENATKDFGTTLQRGPSGHAKDKTMSDQEDFENETEAEQEIILTAENLRQLSPLDWARYGTNRISYMRPVTVINQRGIAINAAVCTQIGKESNVYA
jgi:hypothetical protein